LNDLFAEEMPNEAIERTWPAFSNSMVAITSGSAFGEAVLLRQAGHAAHRQR
jgi:hypothetical protein